MKVKKINQRMRRGASSTHRDLHLRAGVFVIYDTAVTGKAQSMAEATRATGRKRI